MCELCEKFCGRDRNSPTYFSRSRSGDDMTIITKMAKRIYIQFMMESFDGIQAIKVIIFM